MIEAGVYAAKEHSLGSDLADLVWNVYLAMDAERYSSDSASETNDVKYLKAAAAIPSTKSK